MKVAPDADVEDGCFEVLTIGDLTRSKMLMKFPKIYAGTHVGEPGVGLAQAQRMEIRLAENAPRQPALLNLDGEAVGQLPATFEILPKAFPFIVPE